jgi:hypothetical protein
MLVNFRSARFFDRDVQDKLQASARVADVTGKIKEAIETQTNVNVVERDSLERR